ncbi:hypothetical protein [Mucilaginibacter rubeus]|uniref:TonB C-terminal domain-containing protein n=1 Tax=Mucilaginibacter rubeus TaxID=2027860 RepID=A0A5C1I7G6_9SPHI|nr:hypothetical protein [Mucilaginibacter rubeus]QEM13999.1 hypothetical protein DEO27_029620 [Mucilaginibacter rubeus]
MKKNNYCIKLIMMISFLALNNVPGWCIGYIKNGSQSNLQSDSDVTTGRIYRAIYNTYNNPYYWKKSLKPTFTTLKIDVSKKGSITDIRFSDSADSLFKAEFEQNIKKFRSIADQWVKSKSYKGISLLIPVYYETKYELKPTVGYDDVEFVLKFNKKAFTGNTVLLRPVTIRVLNNGNS